MIRMDVPGGTGRAVRWGCVLGARPRLAARGQVSRADDVVSPSIGEGVSDKEEDRCLNAVCGSCASLCPVCCLF
jgi:ferredoxin